MILIFDPDPDHPKGTQSKTMVRQAKGKLIKVKYQKNWLIRAFKTRTRKIKRMKERLTC